MAVLIDNKNNSVIDSERIVKESNKGVVYTDKKSWHYVPKDNISEQNEYKDGYYYNKENNIELEKAAKTSSFLTDENPIQDNYIEKAQYIFGLNNLKFSQVKYNEVCGIESNYIYLGNYNYITLSVKIKHLYDTKSNYSVEYSIIDGNIEQPIIPEEDNRTFEKLFYNMNTRFVVDQTTDTPVLYKYDIYNKELTIIENKSYTELTAEDFNSNDYYLDYKPAGDAHKYIPENNNIKIKAIFRNLDELGYSTIESLTINKYGGAVEWI